MTKGNASASATRRPTERSGALTAALEVERKYDVDSLLPVPELNGVAGTSPGTAAEYALQATYYDTADLRLRRAGITLRHRTGGADDGWTLKLPAGADREELRVVADSDAVPEELLQLVRAWVRGQQLAPVGRLSTRRTVQQLLDADGRALAEFLDDTVTGEALPAGSILRWREWEVELLDGERAILDELEQRLTAAGAVPSSSASKLARVLPGPDADVSAGGAEPGGADTAAGDQRSELRAQGGVTAGAVVQAHLAEQVAELVRRDPQVRRELPDAVHKMRVATRRLRSALATFRPLLDRERTDPLRSELRWLAGVLGGVRDAEVMHTRLQQMVAAEPPDLVMGKVQTRVHIAMTARYRAAHERLTAELNGERYLRLLDDLDSLVAAPPFTEQAGEDAAPVLAKLLRRTWRRLDAAMVAAEQAPPGPRQDELLHEVRKDAKRMRYAAEAVEPVFGRPTRNFAQQLTGLQESLGDFNDGVVTRAVLREFGARGHLAGENGFTFGRLHALEQARAEAAVARWPQARRELSRRKLRKWFDS